MSTNSNQACTGDMCNLSVVNVGAQRNNSTPARFREDSPSGMKMQAIRAIAKEVTRDLCEEKQDNIIANFQLALARASAGLTPQSQDFFAHARPKTFWHTDNDRVHIVACIIRDQIAYKRDPITMTKALFKLDGAIQEVQSRPPETDEQRDRLRQMTENAAIMKMAIAWNSGLGDRLAAKILVSGGGYSVNNLLRIAEANGMNPDNVAQIRAAAATVSPDQSHAGARC